MSDPRYSDWYGLEETLLSASQHLGTYIEYAKKHDVPLTLPLTEQEAEEGGGYAILEHALNCIESLYAACEDGLIVQTDKS
jgi:hypothetical protein